MTYPDGSFGMSGDVKVLFRPHVFEFTWDVNELSDETIIRFDFVLIGDGATRVTVTSFVFDEPDMAYLVIATWRAILERLRHAVETKSESPENEERVAVLVDEIKRQHQRAIQN